MLYLIFTCIEQNALLPKFLNHYKKQGCENAICLIETGVDRNIIYDVFPNSLVYSGPMTLDARVRCYDDNWMREKLADDDWYVIADVDEFALPEDITIYELVKNTKHDHIRGYLIDRHAINYRIPQSLEEDIWKQFPIESDFTKKHGAYTSKIMAASKNIKIENGHHTCKSKNFDKNESIPVHHFKWWGNVLERLKNRNKIEDLPWKEKIERVINTLNEIHKKDIKM